MIDQNSNAKDIAKFISASAGCGFVVGGGAGFVYNMARFQGFGTRGRGLAQVTKWGASIAGLAILNSIVRVVVEKTIPLEENENRKHIRRFVIPMITSMPSFWLKRVGPGDDFNRVLPVARAAQGEGIKMLKDAIRHSLFERVTENQSNLRSPLDLSQRFKVLGVNYLHLVAVDYLLDYTLNRKD